MRLSSSSHRIVIHQDRDSGYLRFSDPKLADRVYSIFNGLSFPNSTSKLEFHLSADGSYEPEPKGPILEVRGLRLKNYNDGLYDLFRPFGPLSICMPIVTARSVQDTGLVRYFYVADSDEALHHLNGKIVEGNAM
ncbi:hypothetical protein BX666DRAFT_252052 [Dichotomocladium elegans]|nr:hypothetical protein BX666DRAFT_252052 [Dichotomocladium elegans]